MGSLGRHLEAVRLQVEAALCTDAVNPEALLKQIVAGYQAPVEAAALYTSEGMLQARRGFETVEPWSDEGFFAEPGAAWLRGRGMVVALSTNTAERAGTVDIRMPLQCEEASAFHTRAWAIVRLNLPRLLERAVDTVSLEPEESVWVAGPDGGILFRLGPDATQDLRLEGLVRLAGPKGGALWERMRGEPQGGIVCDGFDGGRFVFRRMRSEWTTMRLGEVPVLLVREIPQEIYTPPAAGRTGLWRDGKGARLALLTDGASCRLFLQREAGQPPESAFGRLLEATLAARGKDRSDSFQGEFSPAGQLVLSLYSDHELRGVTREVFVFTKGGDPPGTALKPADLPRLRY